jgi:hypothetical protein
VRQACLVLSPLASMPLLLKFQCSLFVLCHLIDVSFSFFFEFPYPSFLKKQTKKKGNSHFAGRKHAYTKIVLEPLCPSWE